MERNTRPALVGRMPSSLEMRGIRRLTGDQRTLPTRTVGRDPAITDVCSIAEMPRFGRFTVCLCATFRRAAFCANLILSMKSPDGVNPSVARLFGTWRLVSFELRLQDGTTRH